MSKFAIIFLNNKVPTTIGEQFTLIDENIAMIKLRESLSLPINIQELKQTYGTILVFTQSKGKDGESKSPRKITYILFVIKGLRLDPTLRKRYQRLRFSSLSIRIRKNIIIVPHFKEKVYANFKYITSPYKLFHFIKKHSDSVNVIPYLVPTTETKAFLNEAYRKQYLTDLKRVLQSIRNFKQLIPQISYKRIMKTLSLLDLRLKVLKERGILLRRLFGVSFKKEYLRVYSSYMRLKKKILLEAMSV